MGIETFTLMTNHSLTPNATPAATEPNALDDRVAAIELFLQQLVFVLDAQGSLNTDALDRWITTARQRMSATGSVPAAQVAALEALQAKVTQ